MSNYDMTDRYGAVMILKAMIDSTAEQMNDEKLGIMRKEEYSSIVIKGKKKKSE